MAKKHLFTRLAMWFGDKQIDVTNQYVRMRYHLEFHVTHDDTVPGDDGKKMTHDYSAIFDLEMLRSRMMEFVKNSLAIVLQNKILRPLTPKEAKAWLLQHDPIKMGDLFPGKTPAKPLTDEELMRTLKSGKSLEERKALAAQIMAE